MIRVTYTRLPQNITDERFEQYLNKLPPSLKAANAKLVKRKDRLANLFGKILLLEALQQYGFDKDCLQYLRYNEYSRPYISNDIDFNLSHSGDYVVCAISTYVKLGIDIEEVKAVDLADFEQVMTPDQWRLIRKSADPLRTFYSFWAIKESVIKADSRGLSIPLQSILIYRNTAECEGREWFCTELQIDTRYCAWLAASGLSGKVELKYKNME